MRSPKIKAEIRAILTDQDGKVIKRYPWKQANSLLKQFIQLFTVQLSQAAQTIKDTSGTDQTVSAYVTNFKCNETTETAYGIVIGTGETPVTMTDYKLETQVTANIAHQTITFATENPSASTWRVAISRGFTNNTGATLPVKEVGLYVYAASSYYHVCIDRTLYAVDVPNGATLTLTYRLTVTL